MNYNGTEFAGVSARIYIHDNARIMHNTWAWFIKDYSRNNENLNHDPLTAWLIIDTLLIKTALRDLAARNNLTVFEFSNETGESSSRSRQLIRAFDQKIQVRGLAQRKRHSTRR